MAKTSKKDESTQDKSAPEKSAEATAKTADAQATDNQSIPAATGLKGPAVAAEKAVKTSNIKTRVEEDLLGKLEVPEDAYYGVHTMRALDNFQISYVTVNSIPEFIRGMVMVKKATAMANRRLHTLPKKKAEAIVWACDQILEEGRCMDQFPLDVF
ncbi:lyase family protein, partial [Corynebacterium stationis]